MNLSAAEHHVGERRNCADCGTRVFTYATATNDAGEPAAHYCTMCADRLRGLTLCRFCFRPIVADDDAETGWTHRDQAVTVFRIRHNAIPEAALHR